jgi:hypothetical protein
MRDLKKDLKIGKREEIKTLILLNSADTIFGKLEEDEDQFANFDFVSEDKKYHVEHKWRPEIDLKTCRYDSLYFDRVKYKRFLELKKEDPEKRCFIIWNCSGTRVWWEFKKYGWENEDGEVEFYFSKQFNQDRGNGYAQDTDMVNVFVEALHPISEVFTETK